MSIKRWKLAELDSGAAAELAEACGVQPFLALLLHIRGISGLQEAEDFLVSNELEDDPFTFADMDAAVERIQRALDTGEKIAVYGDYDADGITATVLLFSYLKSCGGDVCTYIPEREGEGYGLHRSALEALVGQGVRLIVPVDTGISAVEEVAWAAEHGVDVIVTDHHQPQDTLPAAVAVVDPHRADCGSLCKDYAGVGVAFKLACALDGDADTLMESYGDLVALGTLADVMPLRGENRRLVRQGLQVLNEWKRPGLAALAKAAGVGEQTLVSTRVAFTLGPRLNAAGRMGSPELALRLLLAQTEPEAMELAEEIQQMNIQRQQVEASIFEEVLEQIRLDPACLSQRVLVVDGADWHPGVIGILAARLMERFGRPCVVLSRQQEIAKGSGRSLPGFSLFDALQACREELTTFGGHELAAGVTLPCAQIARFREAINAYAATVCPVMPVPELCIDFRLRPSQIDAEKLELLRALEPYGAGNPQPVFGLFQMRLDSITPLKGGQHLRLSLSRDGTRISAMKFHTTPEQFPIPCGALLDLAVTLERNEYRGMISPTIIIKDLRYADTDQEEWLAAEENYRRICRQEPLLESTAPADVIPGRDDMARLYRLLRAAGGWQGNTEQLVHSMDNDRLSPLQVRLALEVFRQAGLLRVEDMGDTIRVQLCTTEGKADLQATPLMQYLQEALR